MQVGYLNVSDHGDIKNIHSKSFSLGFCVCKNIAACLFGVVNVISLSRHKQIMFNKATFQEKFSLHHGEYLSKRSLVKHTCS